MEGLSTEGVIWCTHCKAPWGKFVILGYRNKMNSTWVQSKRHLVSAPLSLAAPSVIGWELHFFHPVALVGPHHPSKHTHTHTHSGCPGMRQQTLFNLFSSALIGSKLPSLPSWCANECGIEGRPPITPQAHLQDTSGCRAAVCDLYMADEGGAGGCKVVSTDLDQSDWSRGKNPWVN